MMIDRSSRDIFTVLCRWNLVPRKETFSDFKLSFEEQYRVAALRFETASS